MILRYQIFIGLVFLSAYFSWKTVKPKYGLIAYLLLFFVLFSALSVSFWPDYTFDTLSLRLRLVSARSFVSTAMNVFFVLSLTSEQVRKSVYFFEYLLFANCISYLYFGFGLFNAGSMDMSFMAMVYPIIAFRPGEYSLFRKVMLFFPIVCLLYNVSGSTVYFALAVGIGSYFVIQRNWKLLLLAVPIFGSTWTIRL